MGFFSKIKRFAKKVGRFVAPVVAVAVPAAAPLLQAAVGRRTARRSSAPARAQLRTRAAIPRQPDAQPVAAQLKAFNILGTRIPFVVAFGAVGIFLLLKK